MPSDGLQISNISKRFGDIHAVRDVSVHVPRGSLIGFLGPNGAGKSTLMRTIAALQAPSAGELFFNDIDVLKQPQALRSWLGYLPQEFGVYPGFSAYRLLDHLAILKGVLNKKERKEQIEALLQQTNLYADRKKAVSTYSGGMRQRFGIAQALLGSPRLIIVDEPTAGLDPEERQRFHDLLSEIASSIIVVLSTHIVEDVRNLCSRLAIMQEGRLIATGVPAELLKQLEGKVWGATIARAELPVYQERYQVISSRLFAGQRRVHVYSVERPAPEFEGLVPSLEEVYFSALYGFTPLNSNPCS